MPPDRELLIIIEDIVAAAEVYRRSGVSNSPAEETETSATALVVQSSCSLKQIPAGDFERLSLVSNFTACKSL